MKVYCRVAEQSTHWGSNHLFKITYEDDFNQICVLLDGRIGIVAGSDCFYVGFGMNRAETRSSSSSRPQLSAKSLTTYWTFSDITKVMNTRLERIVATWSIITRNSLINVCQVLWISDCPH